MCCVVLRQFVTTQHFSVNNVLCCDTVSLKCCVVQLCCVVGVCIRWPESATVLDGINDDQDSKWIDDTLLSCSTQV